LRSIKDLGGLFYLEVQPCDDYNINLTKLNSLSVLIVKSPPLYVIPSVSGICNVKELYLGRSCGISDFALFKDLRKVDLNYNNSIEDVSSLRNVKYLNLTGCRQIIDVSMLGNVKVLNISDCMKVLDVSGLGTVWSLDITGCDGVKDVSTLINVKILRMDSKNQKTSQLSLSKNMIIIKWPFIEDAESLNSLQELKLLSFKENKKIILCNVTPKFNVESLVEYLEGYTEVAINSCIIIGLIRYVNKRIFNFSTIRTLKLSIDRNVHYTLTNLPSLIVLSIRGLEGNRVDKTAYPLPVIDFSTVPKLNSLSIAGVVAQLFFPNEIDGNLENLTFIRCSGTFKIMGEVQKLRTVSCSGANLLLYQSTKSIHDFQQLYQRGDTIVIKAVSEHHFF
jgi:hypothetical protein